MASSPTGPTNVGLDPKIASAICYAGFCCCIGVIFAIVVAVIEKQSRFLRFHAFQSLLYHAVVIVISVIMTILVQILGAVAGGLALVGSIAQMGVGLASFAFSVFMMLKAYNGEEFEIPTLGPMARQWV
jgi:uncharacterized membrane protein